jgi:CDP-4-dehydro-6-deoxyglucose reductase, E1
MSYPLASNSWGEEELQAIESVVRSGRFTMGERVSQFESEFAQKFGSKHAIMVNSGSSANLVALASLFYKSEKPLKRGDEVIVPAVSWSTTYFPFQQYGLRLKFVDVELATLNIDVAQLEAALTPRTRAVVAVNILGNPCNLDVLRSFCDRHGLYLFEDNCESMGAVYKNKYCGTFGDVGTFSTFFSHHISTMEGGLIVTDNDELHQLCLSLRAHGWTRNLPDESVVHERKSDDFFEAYRFIYPGYNVRPLEFSGAIGSAQLPKLDQMIETRRKNAAHFRSIFEKDSRFIIQSENGTSSWYSFTIILNPALSIDRTRVLDSLRKANIEFRMITGGCFLRHDVIRHFDYDVVGKIENANVIHDRGFFVGNFHTDATEHIESLYRVLDEAAR